MSKALQSPEYYVRMAKQFKRLAAASVSNADKQFYLGQAENYVKLSKAGDTKEAEVSARPVLKKKRL